MRISVGKQKEIFQRTGIMECSCSTPFGVVTLRDCDFPQVAPVVIFVKLLRSFLSVLQYSP